MSERPITGTPDKGEPPATIGWRTLQLPWDRAPGEPMSHRAPTDAELVRGSDVLRTITDRFGSAQVIAPLDRYLDGGLTPVVPAPVG